ncbi:MAG TPA: hypothetical protein VL494_13545 [Steroidobacteraceae bacterium]|jgi:hypothetical protein|nr:hypothetical protein [Steroidobacteraceae bacterium]
MNHVPTDLFDCVGIGEAWKRSAEVAKTRRLLVTMWLLHPELSQRSQVEIVARAKAVWDVHCDGLVRAGRVSVATVLAQLKDLGFVRSFDAVEGGFAVELVKEVA